MAHLIKIEKNIKETITYLKEIKNLQTLKEIMDTAPCLECWELINQVKRDVTTEKQNLCQRIKNEHKSNIQARDSLARSLIEAVFEFDQFYVMEVQDALNLPDLLNVIEQEYKFLPNTSIMLKVIESKLKKVEISKPLDFILGLQRLGINVNWLSFFEIKQHLEEFPSLNLQKHCEVIDFTNPKETINKMIQEHLDTCMNYKDKELSFCLTQILRIISEKTQKIWDFEYPEYKIVKQNLKQTLKRRQIQDLMQIIQKLLFDLFHPKPNLFSKTASAAACSLAELLLQVKPKLLFDLCLEMQNEAKVLGLRHLNSWKEHQKQVVVDLEYIKCIISSLECNVSLEILTFAKTLIKENELETGTSTNTFPHGSQDS